MGLPRCGLVSRRQWVLLVLEGSGWFWRAGAWLDIKLAMAAKWGPNHACPHAWFSVTGPRGVLGFGHVLVKWARVWVWWFRG